MREPQKTRRSSLSFQPWRCVQSFFLRTEKQQQKSWTETYGWEPSLLEQIDMDVRGHNMCERMSLSRFKIKEFTFRTHARANIVVAQCWSSISQTYTNASTALEGMVKCQKFQSTRKMLLPAISRKLHGTQPSSAVDCAEVGCWLLPVSYLAATLVHVTIKWFDSILACFRIAQECQRIEATAPAKARDLQETYSTCFCTSSQ